LVARKGKLEIDQEEVGTDPNGTEFVIATKDSPELDASSLVVGRVLEGMEVVEKIGQVKTVQENTTSPYFRSVNESAGESKDYIPQSKLIIT
jgi:peptidyl-prolyl cis-trans isomerase B (cyclophilin B)